MDSPMGIEPVQCVEGGETLEIFTDEGSLLGVDPDMDLEGVRGEEGLAAALAAELELPGVGLLVGLEVTLGGVAPGAASPGAHEPLTRHVVTLNTMSHNHRNNQCLVCVHGLYCISKPQQSKVQS